MGCRFSFRAHGLEIPMFFAPSRCEPLQLKVNRVSMITPHPAVLILLWFCLSLTLQSLQATALLFAGVPLMVVAYALSAMQLFTLLRRTRWIMFSLLLVYAYASPGEAVWPLLGQFSPTREGVIDGLLQLCRLAFALAGLSILLSLLPQQKLIGGLFTLAYPLRAVGLSRERVAVRLALTLRYAETEMLSAATDWQSSIESMLTPAEVKQGSVELHTTPFTLRDSLLLILLCVFWALIWL
jgi:energy-coupling factor transport system permease protein